MDAFAPARSLYTAFGFEPCAPFGEYTDNPHSAYMTIDLAEAAGGRRQTCAE
jgi:putative acetyltransferase